MNLREVGLQVAYLAALFVLPAIGLICLLAGLRLRNRLHPHPPVDAGYVHAPTPPTTYPSQRRNGKTGTTLIVIGCALLTLGTLGIAGNFVLPHFRSPFENDKSMRVGECIDQNAFFTSSFGSGPENGCAHPGNIYELAFKGGPAANCPDGKRDHSVYDRFADDFTVLCFVLNLKQDQCYQLTRGDDSLAMRLGDCDQPRPAQYRVVQRIDGSTDTTRCPPGGKVIAYPVPPRVYCLSPR